eukprot:3551951-Rhodomonas_salina.1
MDCHLIGCAPRTLSAVGKRRFGACQCAVTPAGVAGLRRTEPGCVLHLASLYSRIALQTRKASPSGNPGPSRSSSTRKTELCSSNCCCT